MATPKLTDLVSHIQKLPSLSASVTRVLAEADNPRANNLSIAKIVDEDPPLAARVLRTANSGFYARQDRAGTVAQAISRIGMAEVRQLVLSTVMAQFLGRTGRRINLRLVYAQAIASAALSKLVLKHAKGLRGLTLQDLDRAGTAGLLHDIGLFAMDQELPDALGDAMFLATSQGRPLEACERELFGYSHAEVGSLLLQRWRLTPIEIEVAKAHHDPTKAAPPHRHFACAVLVADSLITAAGLMTELPPLQDKLDQATADALGLTPEAIEQLLKDAVRECTRAKSVAMQLSG